MLPVQLKQNPRLTAEELEEIAAFGATTRWPAGFTVYERLAPADGIFIVRSGQIVLRNPIGAGRSFVPWVATPGETFGGEGLQANARYASAARSEGASETLHLSSAQFSALLREHPTAALALVRQVMAERTTLLEKYGEHATLTVEQRLVAALVRLSAAERGASGGDRPMISRRLLGELVGATRESISLVLGRLSAEGLVEREGNGLIVIEPQRLAERLGPGPTMAAPARENGTQETRVG
ncbi:MAG TPA: Crp/Fnr family transcriptional regulator [Gemmatimonadaceae bacterium]|nr:Crp/Fnr family transcriptional regulator [Gemmatimonadaceae bacterium]